MDREKFICFTVVVTSGGMEVQFRAFLSQQLRAGKWSASQSSSLATWEGAQGIHMVGGLVVHNAGLHSMHKRRNLLALPGIEP
jgi:hypothetical protein